MSIVRPNLFADFLNTRGFLDPRLVYARAAGTNGRATYFNEAGKMLDVPANVPRFDHTIAGVPLGLLMEESTTNYIFNPRNEGSGGTALSTGNMPSNQTWDGTLNGVTITRLPDQVLNGMNGAVYRIAGTAGALTSFHLRTCSTDPAASNGQAWTASGYFALVGGSLSGFSQLSWQNNSVGGTVSTIVDLLPLLSLNQAPFRVFAAATADTGTTAMRSRVRCQVSNGASPSLDLWVGPTQQEQKAFPTSQVIPPAGTVNASNSRSGDTLFGTLAHFGLDNLSVEGTMLMEIWTNPGVMPSPAVLWRVHNGTTADMLQSFRNSGILTLGVQGYVGNVLQASVGAGGQMLADAVSRTGFAWAVNNGGLCRDGSAVAAVNMAALPPMASFSLGGNFSGTQQICGHLRKVVLYSRRLSNTNLQLLTA